MDFEGFFERRLDALRDEGNYRTFADLERHRGTFPRATRHRADGTTHDVTVWCSNDYLGMGQHPDVLAAMHHAIDAHGSGAGGTRNISGTTHHHVLLERELADLHAKRAALVFTSGYVSNWAALGTLASAIPGCIVYSDALNHASMIEGIRHSRAHKRIFRHNDPAHLDELMAADDPAAPKLVAFESVYSMDGDIAPMEEIVEVAEPTRRVDLSRRGARCRPLRPARWRRGGGARPDGSHHRHRGHAGQGVRRDGRLHRRVGAPVRLRALVRVRLHLHHRAPSRSRRGGRPPPSATSRRARASGRATATGCGRCAPRSTPGASRTWTTRPTSCP